MGAGFGFDFGFSLHVSSQKLWKEIVLRAQVYNDRKDLK